MRNIIGSPVDGQDYFSRPQIEKKFKNKLEKGENVLLVAPRRVGKTSLVIRICEDLRKDGWLTAMFNAESCRNELDFAEALIKNLSEQGQHAGLLTRISNGLRKVRESFGSKIGLGGAGFSVEIESSAGATSDTLFLQIETIFKAIDGSDKPTVIAIDELPELLLNIEKQENGDARVGEFLHWLRHCRQTYRKQLRWIMFGSIGLDHFVAGKLQSKTINDLGTLHLDALTHLEADAFLVTLTTGTTTPLPEEARRQIVIKLGWPLPFHLQLFVDAISSLDGINETTVAVPHVEAAFEELLKPDFRRHYVTWSERLTTQFESEDAKLANAILDHLCQNPEGRSREQLFDSLMAKSPKSDPDAVEQRLRDLLKILEQDGYLLSNDERFAFRSFLLREYWKRR